MSYARAVRAFEIRRWQLAQKYLAEELADNPQSSDAYALLAAADLNLAEIKNAVEHARTAIGIDPNSAYPYYILGLALLRDKQVFEAEIALEEALSKAPYEPTYLTACASLYRMYDKKGMELLDQALEQDPTHTAALHAKYERLVANNKKSEAETVRKQILELNPEDASMHEASGWQSLLERDGHARAVDHFRESLRLNPNEQKAVTGLQEAQYQLHNPLARFFKKIWWSKIFICSSASFILSIVYMIACGQWQSDMPFAAVVIFCFVPLAILVVGALVYALGFVLYYIGLFIDGWRRQTVQTSIHNWFAGPWRQKVLGFVIGIVIVAVPLLLDINHTRVPLPHWLYQDWVPMCGTTWRLLPYFAPVVFLSAVGLLLTSAISLLRAHKLKQPLSTWSFTCWLMFSSSWAVLGIFALVAFLGSRWWLIYLVLAVEFTIIGVPVSPVYRNYVKGKLRAQADRMR